MRQLTSLRYQAGWACWHRRRPGNSRSDVDRRSRSDNQIWPCLSRPGASALHRTAAFSSLLRSNSRRIPTWVNNTGTIKHRTTACSSSEALKPSNPPGQFSFSVCATPGVSVFLQRPDVRQPQGYRPLHYLTFCTGRLTLSTVVTLSIETCIVTWRQMAT